MNTEKWDDLSEHVESQSEKQILEGCVSLMQDLVGEFVEWYRFVHGDDAIDELSDEEMFCLKMSNMEIVRSLFLWHTSHSGGTSTCQKCRDLGCDWGESVQFAFARSEDYETEGEEKEEI